MEENIRGSSDERNKVEEYVLDSTSWWRPEFLSSCFSSENVCIPVVLCSLSALLWVIAYFLFVRQQCRTSNRNAGDTAVCALYCFLGNLCSTVGAFLSNQLAIQVLMGVLMAALDVVHFIFIIFPICPWWQSKTEIRMKMMRKRRRQNLLALSISLVLGPGFCLWPGLSAYHQPAERALSGRHLLSLFPQDNAEILGYALGLLSFVIGWTSKFPSLIKAHQGKMATAVQMSSGVLCALANICYASAILICDPHLKSVMRALPWLLASFGCAVIDIVILTLSCYRRHMDHQPLGQDVQSWDSADMQSLLHGVSPAPHRQKGRPLTKHPGLDRTPLHIFCSKKYLKKMTEVGHYMDVNIHPVQPVRKVCLKEVKISREGQSESQPLKRMVKVVRVDDPCSTDSSFDSSSLSSELEWDFEEANPHWNKTRKQQITEAFPLQDWTVHLGPKPTSQSKSDLHFSKSNVVDVAEETACGVESSGADKIRAGGGVRAAERPPSGPPRAGPTAAAPRQAGPPSRQSDC
ncbi:transmembrane protein 44 [Megalops cyprinoides]|uniref:transmembrane protein 44 n=1 Tax=Megalops cyprinoides TaxID=118141 RepID=UPI0018649DB4|nr:transmembrane protein 44 [Megalops cyprinoides]